MTIGLSNSLPPPASALSTVTVYPLPVGVEANRIHVAVFVGGEHVLDVLRIAVSRCREGRIHPAVAQACLLDVGNLGIRGAEQTHPGPSRRDRVRGFRNVVAGYAVVRHTPSRGTTGLPARSVPASKATPVTTPPFFMSANMRNGRGRCRPIAGGTSLWVGVGEAGTK